MPKSACEHDITASWNQVIKINRFWLIGQTIIKNKRDKISILINVAIPSDRNVLQKKADKKLKYEELSTEIQGRWKYEMLCHTGSHWG
jgi:hypothetical protein